MRRADDPGLDDFRLGSLLDAYCDDTGFEFLQLRAMLARWPAEEDWQKMRLIEMWTTLQAEHRQRSGEAPARTRRVVTQAEHREALEEIRRLKLRLKAADQQRVELERLREENAELRAELKRLRAENARLRAVVADMEPAAA